MSDVEDYFQNSQLSAKQSNVAALGDDPDEAAEALDLSDSTGVPSTAIYGDLDGFKRAHKAALGSAIISDNEYIADYLNSHPMAARVSHDDLGALDDVSRSLDSFYKDTRLGQWLKSDSVAKSFEAGWGEQPFGQAVFQRPSDVEWALSHPLVASVAGAVSMPLEALTRTTGGLLHLGYDGMSQVFGEKFAREMAGMAEYGMMRGDIGVKGGGGVVNRNADLLQNIRNHSRALDAADLYTSADKEPAINIHPLIDKAHELQAKEDIDGLDEALSTATKSATRERSPDFFSQFIRGHVGDREIGLSADAVRKLYPDKPPTPDDGILGWVPDLDKKLASAELTGDDVRVPLADWLAKVDPEIAKQLHDDVRVRDNGFTLNETKIEAEPKEAISGPLQATRGSAGLEPMFSVGDRKLSLQRREIGERGLAPAITADEFRIHDETGQKVGWLEVTPFEGGKKLYVDNIGGFESFGFGPNSFGPALTRDLARQLKVEYPQAEQIGGFRISGAREKAGTTREVWIKFDDMEGPSAETHQYFRNLLSQNWEDMGQGLSALFHEEGKGLAANSPMGQIVLSELRRIAPHVESDIAHQLESAAGPVGGVFIPNLRSIIVSLMSKDPLGTLRHEAVHGLWELFSDKERATLEKAVTDEGWMEKYDVERRWGKFKGADFPQEAVAEAYKDWAGGAKFKSEHVALFQRIKDFID